MLVTCVSISAFATDTAFRDTATVIKPEYVKEVLATSIEDATPNMLRSANVRVYQVQIDGDALNLTGKIGSDEFEFAGTLYLSKSAEEGDLVYVAALTDLNENFEVEYFEITQSESGNPMVATNLTGKAMLKMYLTDISDGSFIMLETDLPEELTEGRFDVPVEYAKDIVDTAWFLNVNAITDISVRSIFSFTEEEIMADEALRNLLADVLIRPMSTYYYTNNNVYSFTANLNFSTYTYRGTVTMTTSPADVGYSGTSDWNASITLTQTYSINGVAQPGTANVFVVKNAVASTAVGGNTVIKRMIPSYTCENPSTSGSIKKLTNLGSTLIGLTYSGTISVSLVRSALSALSSLVSTGTTTTATANENYSYPVYSSSFAFNSNSMLTSSSHKFSVGFGVATVNSNWTRNVTQNAILKFTYSVYKYGDTDLIANDSLTREFTYKSNQ